MSAPVMDRPMDGGPGLPQGPRSSGPGPSGSPRYGALRAVGAGLTGLIVLSGVISTVPEMAQRTEVQDLGWDDKVTTLRVAGNQGDVDITEATAGVEPTIQVEKTWAFTAPEVSYDVVDGTASVGIACELRLFARCSADWTIVVPEGTAVEVKSSVGEVQLESVTGAVSVRGDVGDVHITGAPTSLDIVTSVGDVNALLTSPATSVRVRTNVGDVDLRLPGEVSYDVNARSDLPDVLTTVPTDDASPYDVDVTTNVGEVNIRPTH